MSKSAKMHRIATWLGGVIDELDGYPDDADDNRYHYLLGMKAAYILAFQELTR